VPLERGVHGENRGGQAAHGKTGNAAVQKVAAAPAPARPDMVVPALAGPDLASGRFDVRGAGGARGSTRGRALQARGSTQGRALHGHPPHLARFRIEPGNRPAGRDLASRRVGESNRNGEYNYDLMLRGRRDFAGPDLVSGQPALVGPDLASGRELPARPPSRARHGA
jgi:hypothetical protein